MYAIDPGYYSGTLRFMRKVYHHSLDVYDAVSISYMFFTNIELQIDNFRLCIN